jgi:peptidyl-tRNA hydrolase, PTH1 family
MAEDGLWLVVGLGNPGPHYAGTRHNVGALVVDVLGDRAGGRFKSHRARADLLETRLAGVRVALAKPRSYMNESGGPVAGLRDFFKLPIDRIVAVHDELDLPYGALRLKLGGGDNGHNGLKSLRTSLGSGDFYRVRVGIGRPTGRQDPADWVLRPFAPTERKDLDLHLERAADAVETLVEFGLAEAQNRYND